MDRVSWVGLAGASAVCGGATAFRSSMLEIKFHPQGPLLCGHCDGLGTLVAQPAGLAQAGVPASSGLFGQPPEQEHMQAHGCEHLLPPWAPGLGEHGAPPA